MSNLQKRRFHASGKEPATWRHSPYARMWRSFCCEPKPEASKVAHAWWAIQLTQDARGFSGGRRLLTFGTAFETGFCILTMRSTASTAPVGSACSFAFLPGNAKRSSTKQMLKTALAPYKGARCVFGMPTLVKCALLKLVK